MTLPSTHDDEGSVEEGGAVTVPLERRLWNVRTAASFAVAFVIMYFAFSRINVDPRDIIAHIRQANIGLYLIAFFVYYLSFPLRAWRWQALLANIGYRRDKAKKLPSLAGLAEIIFLSWFANCVVPAKLGDAYRGYLLKRSANVSFSRTFGTVLAERILDLLVLVVLMALTALGMFGAYLPTAVEYLFVVGFVLVLLIVAILVAMKKFGRQLEQRLPSRLRAVYVRFAEGTLESFKNLPFLLALTLVIWAIEAARFWFILSALGLFNVSILVVIFTSLAASLLTTLPVTPGGLGLVESGVVGLLLFLGTLGLLPGGVCTQDLPCWTLFTSVAILDRTISYWSLVVLGALAYLVSRRK